jgi:hypothetical protein
LIEQLDHQAAETPDPAHEPIPLVAQSPAAAQSDVGKLLDATHRDAAKAAATVPTGNVSETLH